MVGQPARDDAPRYETLFRLAVGGMATVYVGTVRGALGFRQLVAIKKPHAHLLHSPEFRQAFLTEARLASLLHHANVVDVRDVEATQDEVNLIMDYVEGASLGDLLQAASIGGPLVAPSVAVRIVLDACAGLHAAHELTDERGRPLNLVHRDISPQNLLVGLDGVTRVADFGVAKFSRKAGQSTTDGNLKGKLAYMAPEYLRAQGVDRRLDVFAMGVVLWEALTGQRLFRGQSEADTLQRVLEHSAPPVSSIVPAAGTSFDAIVDTALAKLRDQRFDNAEAMATALESSARGAGLLAGHRDVAELVRRSVGQLLDERRTLIRSRLAHEPSVVSAMVEPGRVPVELAPTESAPTLREPSGEREKSALGLGAESSPSPVTLASANASAELPVPRGAATGKVEGITLRSELSEPIEIPAASPAEEPSSRPFIPGVGRLGRYVAPMFGGLVVAVVGTAMLLHKADPSPGEPSALAGFPAVSPPAPTASSSASPAPSTPASAALTADTSVSSSPAPSVRLPAHAATVRQGSSSAPVHPSSPPRQAAPVASPRKVHDTDPPPNPYAPP
jgi:hypothetical protein